MLLNDVVQLTALRGSADSGGWRVGCRHHRSPLSRPVDCAVLNVTFPTLAARHAQESLDAAVCLALAVPRCLGTGYAASIRSRAIAVVTVLPAAHLFGCTRRRKRSVFARWGVANLATD